MNCTNMAEVCWTDWRRLGDWLMWAHWIVYKIGSKSPNFGPTTKHWESLLWHAAKVIIKSSIMARHAMRSFVKTLWLLAKCQLPLSCWHSDATGFALDITSRGCILYKLPVGVRLHYNSGGQVVHIHVPPLPKPMICYRSVGSGILQLVR